jgi:hypothetical protein
MDGAWLFAERLFYVDWMEAHALGTKVFDITQCTDEKIGQFSVIATAL